MKPSKQKKTAGLSKNQLSVYSLPVSFGQADANFSTFFWPNPCPDRAAGGLVGHRLPLPDDLQSANRGKPRLRHPFGLYPHPASRLGLFPPNRSHSASLRTRFSSTLTVKIPSWLSYSMLPPVFSAICAILCIP